MEPETIIGIILLIVCFSGIGMAVLFAYARHEVSKTPDWKSIRELISIVKPEHEDLIAIAENQNEERSAAIWPLCEALIEGGYISAYRRPQLFEQAERLIEILSSSQIDRQDCLGRSVGYYEMIGKRSKAQVLMSELYRMPPSPALNTTDMPAELAEQMHNFWCRMTDGQRQIHRENYDNRSRV